MLKTILAGCAGQSSARGDARAVRAALVFFRKGERHWDIKCGIRGEPTLTLKHRWIERGIAAPKARGRASSALDQRSNAAMYREALELDALF
jgi:hypothetical protein